MHYCRATHIEDSCRCTDGVKTKCLHSDAAFVPMMSSDTQQKPLDASALNTTKTGHQGKSPGVANGSVLVTTQIRPANKRQLTPTMSI